MLPRLSSSLPSATASLARSATPHAQRLPACVRFNSSEVAQSSEPKKRGVPLALNLGDVNIRNGRPNGQNRGGQRREGGNPRGQQYQDAAPRDRQPGRPHDRQPGRAPAGLQSEQRGPRDGQRHARPPRARDASNSNGAAQKTALDKPREQSSVVIPKPAEIELGNLHELFGASTSPSSSQTVSAIPRKDVTPSQVRIQLLLEKTAGDYSRYVPRPFPTTDVRKLGPVKLGEFVLSRKRDVGLTARQNVLTVVEKFAGGKGVRVS
ncbi:hypothetical protein C8T65DRAFT_736216 [Cerioporus squamosus]|nr:hypothetical protein C8T65DRAFT_736216 [Cerioporus squamosus]